MLTFRNRGLSYQAIAEELNVSERVIQTAYKHDHSTPSKYTGKSPILSLTASPTLRLINFVYASKTNRRMPYSKLTTIPSLRLPSKTSKYAIQSALKRAG